MLIICRSCTIQTCLQEIIPLCFQPQNGLPFTLYILFSAKEIWPWWAACLKRLVPSTNGMGWGVTDWTGVVRTNHRDEMLNVWNSTSANIPMLCCRTSLLAAYKEFISHEREFKTFTVLKSPKEALTPWNDQTTLKIWFFFSLVTNCLD